MGRGRSGLKGGGKQAAAPTGANTPSGISYAQFMSMPDDQKYQTMDDIINDSSISVPPYLDGSDTTKVLYALGMDNKPTVVSDAQIDSLPGKDLYRTVYESGSMPPPSSADILDQIRNGDYTQMSGSGGSVHGRAIYFAEGDFRGSALYGSGERNAMMMRAKINPNANIVDERTLRRQMNSDVQYGRSRAYASVADDMALYALAHGIDGWRDNATHYTMIVNRGILTASSQNKSLRAANKTTGKPSRGYARSWAQAANV